jgi:hypothetical protein
MTDIDMFKGGKLTWRIARCFRPTYHSGALEERASFRMRDNHVGARLDFLIICIASFRHRFMFVLVMTSIFLYHQHLLRSDRME